MTAKKTKGKPIHLPQVTLAIAESEERVADCVFYAGASVPYWPFDRVTFSLEQGACDLSRFESGAAPVLLNHNRWDVRDQVGVIQGAQVADGKASASLRFTSREDFAGMWSDIKAGIIANVSVGLLPLEILEVVNGELPSSRIGVVTKWQPYELSIVAVPQDPACQIAMSKDEEIEFDLIELQLSKEGPTMAATATGVTDAQTQEQARSAAAAAERERVLSIQARGKAAGIEMSIVDQHVNAGSSLADACLAFVDAVAAKQQATLPTPAGTARVERDQFDTIRMGLANALEHRVAPKVKLEEGRQFHGHSLLQIAMALHEARTGKRLDPMPPAQMYETIQMAQHGTADFPLLLANVAGKRLRAAYGEANPTYQVWAKRGTARDFKTISSMAFGEFANLPELPENAVITRATVGESREQWAVLSYGQLFAISRQSIINDDLRAFDQTIPRLANAAARTRNALVYAKLAANGNMSDGVALFHATHTNLGTGGVISDTTLTEARRLMRLQKGVNTTVTLDIVPRFLLIPVELEVIAAKWITSTTAPAQPSEVNFHYGKLEVVSDPQLSLASATAWYLAADPAAQPTIEYTTLEGFDEPRIATQDGWLTEGVEMKVLDDFGVGVEDWRGLVKNAGA